MAENKIGLVFQFFAKPSVAAVKITDGTLKVGDRIHILGNTTDLKQIVDSMQVEHAQIPEGKPGDQVGIKVRDRVRPHDVVYKVTE
ncbi:MAG: EF-Tu/IF-2/RF-3 family GTPase [Candidatus Altiarchaeota archaeon]